MSQLKRYACQTGKVVAGIPIVILGIAIILGFSVFAGEVLVYILDNFWVIRSILGILILLLILVVAFLIGDDIFKKYNICQRFR
jgi:amino acid permease